MNPWNTLPSDQVVAAPRTYERLEVHLRDFVEVHEGSSLSLQPEGLSLEYGESHGEVDGVVKDPGFVLLTPGTAEERKRDDTDDHPQVPDDPHDDASKDVDMLGSKPLEDGGSVRQNDAEAARKLAVDRFVQCVFHPNREVPPGGCPLNPKYKVAGGGDRR